jgi:hypothetical protein
MRQLPGNAGSFRNMDGSDYFVLQNRNVECDGKHHHLGNLFDKVPIKRLQHE